MVTRVAEICTCKRFTRFIIPYKIDTVEYLYVYELVAFIFITITLNATSWINRINSLYLDR